MLSTHFFFGIPLVRCPLPYPCSSMFAYRLLFTRATCPVILSYSGGLSEMIPCGKVPVTGYMRLTRLFHNLRDRCALILNVRLDAKHDDE